MRNCIAGPTRLVDQFCRSEEFKNAFPDRLHLLSVGEQDRKSILLLTPSSAAAANREHACYESQSSRCCFRSLLSTEEEEDSAQQQPCPSVGRSVGRLLPAIPTMTHGRTGGRATGVPFSAHP